MADTKSTPGPAQYKIKIETVEVALTVVTGKLEDLSPAGLRKFAALKQAFMPREPIKRRRRRATDGPETGSAAAGETRNAEDSEEAPF